jgi:hypothetical protein
LDAELDVHAFARHEPAGHAAHAAMLVAAVPPLLKVPGPHATPTAAEPEGQ